ncbi:uncharacterized protein LOC119767710 [Culex quinquefasciatus]|uniref:uncharacterized protein LOC119767710 n=1 Tax=Culex quinquefasciatus TaxID=7176 RepID=UPI0018E30FDE|nr:uncharacterized protein LOC119767710 [Culex quinquefasciatus]
MKSALFLLLALALTSTVWAAVPTGCVQLKNRYVSKYLASSSGHDADRRNVEHSSSPHTWVITHATGEWYRIKHKKLNEELFESVQHHKVFTWIKKAVINDGGADWKIYDSGTWDHYYIRNKKFDHCLYTDEWRTAVTSYGGCTEFSYEWEIKSVSC